MADSDVPASPTASTAVGSVAGSGYRMDEPYHDGSQDATEESGLLGARAGENGTDEVARERTESWIGWEDFNDIPPWRRPSVSATVAQLQEPGH